MPVVAKHFVPEEGATLSDYLERGDRTAVHHLIRYEWACELLAAAPGVADVLDVGCGSGYGSYRVARAIPSLKVTGADYDPAAVAFATQHYEAPNLHFRQGDVVEWDETLGETSYDLVICFDTLEYVSHRDLMMKGIADHLRPEGTLLLSTPVRSKPDLEPESEHHRIEYSPDSLYDLVSRYFEVVLTPEERTLPRMDVFDDLNRDEVIYLLRMNPLVCRSPVKVRAPGAA